MTSRSRREMMRRRSPNDNESGGEGWLEKLFFPRQSDAWLTLFRLGLGLQLALYALSLRRDWMALYSTGGRSLVSRELAEAILAADSPLIPRLGWLVSLGSFLGLSEPAVLTCAWAGIFGAACFLLVGLFSRSAAISAWFLHLCAVKSGTLFTYGMDSFMSIGLFYLMLSPLPDRFSLDCRLRKLAPKDRHLYGFYRRVLQLHLCLIYFFGGLTKCLGFGWWNGASLWRALTRPPFNVLSPEMLLSWKHFLPLFGICVCLIETTYPVLIWWKRTRLLWLLLVCPMHIVIGITMRLHLFALIMIVLNLAAFAPEYLSALKNKLSRPGSKDDTGSAPSGEGRAMAGPS
jgi:Vitamin K-dependent gamma-carboxylase